MTHSHAVNTPQFAALIAPHAGCGGLCGVALPKMDRHMKAVSRIFLTVLGALLALKGHAALTAEELLAECESVSGSYCEGYIAGFYDGRTTSDYGKPELKSCPPTDPSGNKLAISYQQMVLVFRKWAKDHPEKLHHTDWQSLREAFALAWPCN